MSDLNKNNKELTQVDLNTFANAQNLRVKIETIEEEQPEDAKLRRWKDKCLFIVTLTSISIVFLICIGLLIFNQNSPYAGIALNAVIALTTALAGYYVRGKTK